LSGDWQGSLNAGERQVRLVVHIGKGQNGGWNATFVSIDESPDRGAVIPAAAVTVDGSEITFAIPAVRGHYKARLAADGNSMTGTWRQDRPLHLDLARATSATAWRDPSPHSVQFVTVDRDVQLEVLDWGGPSNAQARTLVLLAGLGNTAH